VTDPSCCGGEEEKMSLHSKIKLKLFKMFAFRKENLLMEKFIEKLQKADVP
jgi:hypothetical protein